MPTATATMTAIAPPKTRPELLLAPGIPALPNPEATAFVCDVVGPTALVALKPLVAGTGPIAKLVVGFVLAAVVCGPTSSRIEEVMFTDDVMLGADVMLAGDAVVLGGQVKREFESVSRVIARKCVATAAPVKVVNAVTVDPLNADAPPVALHAIYVVPWIAHPKVAVLAHCC
jgi:hypothetical protein